MNKKLMMILVVMASLAAANPVGADNTIPAEPVHRSQANVTPDDLDQANVTPEDLDQAIDSSVKDVLNMVAVPTPLTEAEASRYTLGTNDVIEITVMRHPEVSGQYAINSEGKIQYEFVGDIKISEMVKDEVAKVVKERLSEYIVNPEVNVKIVGYNSKVVYVVGEVGHPGKIFMRGDTITVREALMQAGLPLLSGITKKSRLITPSESGAPVNRKVNVHALLFEGDLRENLVMNPGDILYIPPTMLTKAMRAIQPVAAPLGTAAGTGRTVMGVGF